MIRSLLLCLSSMSVAVAAPVQDAVLSAELLTAHPAGLVWDFPAYVEDVLSAIEADPGHPLVRDAVDAIHMVRISSDDPLDAQRLMDLAGRVRDPEAGLTLRMLAATEVGITRFATDPLPMIEDPFPEFVQHWRWFGGTGPASHPLPALLEDLPNGPETWSVKIPDNPFATQTDWAHLERSPNQTGVSLAGRVWPATGCSYLAAIVRFDRPDVRVEVRTLGAARAWWNGTRLFDAPRVDPLDVQDLFTFEVPCLNQWNLLLIRMPSTQEDEVAVRFFDTKGAVVSFQEFPWGDTLPFPMTLEPFEPKPIDDVVSLDPADPFTGPLTVRRRWNAGRPDEALIVPRPEGSALALTAWRSEVLRALQGARHLPAETQRTKTMELVAEFEAEGPFLPAARLARAFRLRGEDRPVEALAIIRGLLAESPDNVQYRLYEIMTLTDLDPSLFLAQPKIQALVQEHPESAGAQFMLASHLAGEGDWVGAHEAANAALRADGSDPNIIQLVQQLAEQDSLAAHQFKAQLERWVSREPEVDLAADLLAEIDSLLGHERAKIQRALDQMLGAHVDHPLYMMRLGNEHARLGEIAQAQEAWSGALTAVPAARELWRALALTGSTDRAEDFFQRFAPDLDAALEAGRAAEGLSVIEALDSGMVFVLPDGSAVQRFHTISVVGDRAGAETLHEQDIQNGVRVARILKADGSTLEPSAVNGQWIMPAVEPGDAIEYVWEVEVPVGFGVPTELGRWRFQSFDKPFFVSRYAIFVPNPGFSYGPPETVGELHTFHFDGEHEEIPWEDGVVHIYTRTSDRASAEDFRPSDWEILPWLVFAKGRDGSGVLGTWRAQLAAFGSIPADIGLEFDAYLEQFDQEDPLERARAIHQALDARIIDSQGSPLAAHVWLSGRGNRLFLFAALCERAGIPIHWALLDGGTAPELDTNPVRAFEGDGLSYVPVLILGDPHGACAWQIAAPQPGMPFGMVPPEMVGCSALLLSHDGADTIEVPRSILDETWDLDLDLTYTIDAGGNATVAGIVRFPNLSGAMMRQQIDLATLEERSGYARQLLGQLIQGIDPESFEFPGLGGPPGPAEMTFTGRVPGFLTKDFQGWRADLRLPVSPFARELGPAERDWPMALRFSQRTRMHVTVDPGDAWNIVSAPEPFREERQGLLYAFETPPSAEGWEALRTFVVRGTYLEAADVPAFLLRLRELEEAEATPLRFEATR
tara:strand:- start:2339 stop:5974 length:3636 start_codon:yes stop_codon:yes gene_type:complete